MKRHCSQWLFVTGIVSLALLGALILFEPASTQIADSVLTPWFAICRNITPASWQVRGNILLFMMWLTSGIIAYSMLIGVTVVGLLAIVKRRRRRDRSAEVNEQSRGLTHSRTHAVGVLLFLILFSTLAIFVAFGSDSVAPVATRSTESVPVIEKPRHKRVDKTLPVVAVYEGLIRSMMRGVPSRPSVLRAGNMYVCSHIESLVQDGQTLRVHVLDPDLGDTRLLNQLRGIGTYRAVVVPKHTGPIQFHRTRGKPTPAKTSFLADPIVSSPGTFLSRACRARAQGHGTAATPSPSRSPLLPSQRTCQPDMV